MASCDCVRRSRSGGEFWQLPTQSIFLEEAIAVAELAGFVIRRQWMAEGSAAPVELATNCTFSLTWLDPPKSSCSRRCVPSAKWITQPLLHRHKSLTRLDGYLRDSFQQRILRSTPKHFPFDRLWSWEQRQNWLACWRLRHLRLGMSTQPRHSAICDTETFWKVLLRSAPF